jgi:hypothetical protein
MRFQRIVIISLSIIFFVSIVHAQIANSTKETQNMGSKNSFGGMLVLTNDKNFSEILYDAHKPGISLRTIHLVERNKPIETLLIFHGSAYNDKGLSNVTADIRVLAPDGSVYGEEKNINCLNNLPTPLPGELQLCNGRMEIVIEDKDKPGRYTVEAKIRDNIQDVERSLKQYFEVK